MTAAVLSEKDEEEKQEERSAADKKRRLFVRWSRQSTGIIHLNGANI